MNKKYIVRLSDAERRVCEEVAKKLKGTSQKVRRAQVLLKANAEGAGWTEKIFARRMDVAFRQSKMFASAL